MFKRFLKFFRGDEHSPEEPFEGSYLDHLLEQVRPAVEEQLEECPDHDPLLLVVAGILRLTMMNEWSPVLRSPLVDSQSPGKRPPPAPVPPDALSNPAKESDTTNEFEIVVPDDDELVGADTDDGDDIVLEEDSEGTDLETDDSAEEDSDEHDSDEEDSDERDSDERHSDEEDSDDEEAEAQEPGADVEESDSADDVEPAASALSHSPDETFDEPPNPPTERPHRKTEEIDVEEVRQASLRRTRERDEEREREQSTLRQTAEMDAFEPDPTIEIEQDTLFEVRAESEDGRPRLDTEEVLQAGRVFLGLLIENDRLPVELQLTVGETTLARDLLLGYFVGNDGFEDRARNLLTLVEQKFGDGMFSQARILLELFHTDEQTRISNDRNLFYEDMILRLGIRRRHRLSKEEVARFSELSENARSPEGSRELCVWLQDRCGIKFHCFNRSPAQVDSWSEMLSRAERDGAEANFLRYIPPRRWRPIAGEGRLSPPDRMGRHISNDTARNFVLAQLKTCYFVLRAVGDTGLETFLDTFFDWTRERFDFDGTRLMPELYKRSMMDPEPMEVILRELYDEHFAQKTESMVEKWSDEDIENAMYDALQTIENADLSEVAPGFYDLGAFTYDQLFGVEYPTAEFSFKVHRLT